MKNEIKNRVPVCPSCGQPVRFGFLRFKLGDKVKTLLVVLLIGYVTLSISILAMVLPPQLRKHCDRYDYQHQPDYCKDNRFALWAQPFNKELGLQIFVGGGLAIGILVFYWDWLQNMYENRQQKREKPMQKFGKTYKCRNCGRQWD